MLLPCRIDPVGASTYDGISIDPLETVFVPTHARLVQLEHRIGHAMKAQKYLTWYYSDKHNTTWLSMNEHSGPSPNRHILAQILITHVEGLHCFNHVKYLQGNPDLKVGY